MHRLIRSRAGPATLVRCTPAAWRSKACRSTHFYVECESKGAAGRRRCSRLVQRRSWSVVDVWALRRARPLRQERRQSLTRKRVDESSTTLMHGRSRDHRLSVAPPVGFSYCDDDQDGRGHVLRRISTRRIQILWGRVDGARPLRAKFPAIRRQRFVTSPVNRMLVYIFRNGLRPCWRAATPRSRRG